MPFFYVHMLLRFAVCRIRLVKSVAREDCGFRRLFFLASGGLAVCFVLRLLETILRVQWSGEPNQPLQLLLRTIGGEPTELTTPTERINYFGIFAILESRMNNTKAS